MLVRIEKKINNNITTYPGEVISVKILEGWYSKLLNFTSTSVSSIN